MMIYGIPLSEIEWTTLWMLGSAVITLVGFVGWQVGKFIVGAKLIASRDEVSPKYNWVREKILPGYLANQSFKRSVAERHLQSASGNFCFKLMLFGLVTHIGFWVYAANVLNK